MKRVDSNHVLSAKEKTMAETIQNTLTADGPNMVTGAIELLWPRPRDLSGRCSR
jgi:hypothetical protein